MPVPERLLTLEKKLILAANSQMIWKVPVGTAKRRIDAVMIAWDQTRTISLRRAREGSSQCSILF